MGIGRRHRLQALRTLRKQRCIPLRSSLCISHADDTPHRDRGLCKGTNMRLPFGLITIEDRVARLSTDDMTKPPGQVHGVTNTRAHALTRKRRRLMSRIACKDGMPASPILCDQTVEPVDRLPIDEDILLAHPRAQQ